MIRIITTRKLKAMQAEIEGLRGSLLHLQDLLKGNYNKYQYEAGQSEQENNRLRTEVEKLKKEVSRLEHENAEALKKPRYMSVIPESFSYKMTVERRSLIKSIDRLNFFSNSSSNMIRMGLTKNELCLNAEDKDFDLSGEEKLPCEFVKQDGSGAAKLSIGIKATSLSDTLKVLSTEEVIFNFTDETRAFVIYPKPQPDVEDVTMLLMPMLIG